MLGRGAKKSGFGESGNDKICPILSTLSIFYKAISAIEKFEGSIRFVFSVRKELGGRDVNQAVQHIPDCSFLPHCQIHLLLYT